MEKKIERVPYISKWYKEEKDELLNFDFKDVQMTEETAKELNKCFKEIIAYLNAGSYYDVDKFSLYDKNLYTYSTNTTNGLWTTGYSKPTVQLKYVCNLTEEDLDYLNGSIKSIVLILQDFFKVKSRNRLTEIDSILMSISDYINNYENIRDKEQERQLKNLEKQSKPKKSYEGTLGEHWKELMNLFEIKSKYGINLIKNIDENCLIAFQNDWDSTNKLHNVFNKLGIDFIKDFIKACEKCEE